MDRLATAHSLHAMKSTLQSLSTGTNDLYESAMKRISDGDYGEEAINYLMWIVCAEQPLNRMEMEHAIATTPGDQHFQSDKIVDAEDVVSNCAGLVVLDESGILRLVHKTAIEYFDNTRTKWFPEGDLQLGQVCLTYLLFDNFGSRPPLAGESNAAFDKWVRPYHLLNYALNYWSYHAFRVAQDLEINQLVSTFLNSKRQVENSLWAMCNAHSEHVQLSAPTYNVTGLYLASYLGVPEAVSDLLANGAEVNALDSQGTTPLMYASQKYALQFIKWKRNPSQDRYTEIVDMLLQAGAAVNLWCLRGQTALHRAANNGNQEIFRLLLKRSELDINALTLPDGESALTIAASCACPSIVQ